MQGIIIENKSNLYKVASIEKENKEKIYESKVRGKFKQEDISPVVGDYVEIKILPKEEEKEQAVIEKINPRKVFIKRPKIANITQMILVLSSKNPKPDLIMLDKQLAFAEYMGVKAVIVLNKIDLDKDKKFEQIKSIYESIGYKVVNTMAKEGNGIEELKKVLHHNINVFSGNSGVGKSTLINSIFGKEMTEEGQISRKNKRGKNTTTKTRLYEIEKDTYIADTPRIFYF
ncbi:MAG: ribosome small subunit-dependent GTPase A [Clostridia bacterium]|nr:ribosome small subunit-dependent GTPase A [Clostridia bacterium]